MSERGWRKGGREEGRGSVVGEERTFRGREVRDVSRLIDGYAEVELSRQGCDELGGCACACGSTHLNGDPVWGAGLSSLTRWGQRNGNGRGCVGEHDREKESAVPLCSGCGGGLRVSS